MMIKVKRIYDPPEASDGARILVDRLWPRGRTRASLQMTAWVRDVAPEDDLRHWFNHEPAKWDEFKRRYFAFLDQHQDRLQPLLDAANKGDLTLLFAAHAVEQNNAVALKIYLDKLLGNSA